MTKFSAFCVKFIHVLFILITGFLFLLSLSRHCESDIYSSAHSKSLIPHNPVLYIVLALVLFAAITAIYILSGKIKTINDDKFIYRYMIFSAILTALVCIIWINFNDTLPRLDQNDIFQEARKMTGYNPEPYDYGYLTALPRQRALILFEALLIKIFGDTPMSFKYYNMIMVAALIVGMELLIKEQIKDNRLVITLYVVLLFFYPIIVYSCFLYGTISAVTFEAWGFWALLRYSKEHKWYYILTAAICFTCGPLMHQSAFIGLIAGLIFLFLNTSKKRILYDCLMAVCVFTLYLGSSKAIDYTCQRITNAPNWYAAPASTWIYMGLTADEAETDGGPGAQDGSNSVIFAENDENPDKTNEAVVRELKKVAREYINHERPWGFFYRKVQFEWLDPSVDAHKAISLNRSDGTENCEAFDNFYFGDFRNAFFHIGIAFMILLYGMNLYTGIVTLKKNKEADIHFLIQIFMIGGFVFQLIWESSSRYVVSYYIMLIPEAVYGISLLVRKLDYKIMHGPK